MSELSPEDALRLHVLLAGEVHAVRIDENAPALLALTPDGEARIALHPVGRADAYLMRVRELLGGHALDSPGGYPVHLRHWTRTAQAEAKNLQAMLLLGEPEAVAAVAHAPGLTDELARRAWWALPTMEMAHCMLGHAAVRAGRMGPVLADFLIEHLPFEADPIAAMNVVRGVLAAGLLGAEARHALWLKAKRRPHYLLGFLEALPDELPAEETPRPVPEGIAAQAQAGQPWARQSVRCAAAAGRVWLRAAEQALEKPPAHEAVYLALDLIGGYFAPLRGAPGREALPAAEAAAMAALAEVGAHVAEPVLTRTTAVGPLMRRKLDPLLAPILEHLRTLRSL